MHRYLLTIRCDIDGCGKLRAWAAEPSAPAKDTRAEARADGWVIGRDGEDRCPAHATTEQTAARKRRGPYARRPTDTPSTEAEG